MKVSNTIAGIATLALAAVPMFAMGTAAHAAQPVTVQVADIDFASTDGAREYNRRVNVAAVEFCADFSRLSERANCKAAVRQEVSEKVAAITAPSLYAAR